MVQVVQYCTVAHSPQLPASRRPVRCSTLERNPRLSIDVITALQKIKQLEMESLNAPTTNMALPLVTHEKERSATPSRKHRARTNPESSDAAVWQQPINQTERIDRALALLNDDTVPKPTKTSVTTIHSFSRAAAAAAPRLSIPPSAIHSTTRSHPSASQQARTIDELLTLCQHLARQVEEQRSITRGLRTESRIRAQRIKQQAGLTRDLELQIYNRAREVEELKADNRRKEAEIRRSSLEFG